MHTPLKDRFIPVHRLLAGETARVCRVLGHSEYVHRLAELGLRGGTEIQMFQPGNPCILRVAGNKLCLRTDGVLGIMVEPLPHAPGNRAPRRRRLRWRGGRGR